MKKLLLILLLCLPALAIAGLSVTPGTPAHTHSDANTGGGTLAVSGTLSSTKACATNFVRVQPNYCHRLSRQLVYGTVSGTCAASTALAGVTDAVAIQISLDVRVASTNVVGLRSNLFTLYASPACTGAATSFQPSMREQVAVVAGTVLGTDNISAIVPSAVDGRIGIINATANVDVLVIGYFD